MSIVQSVENMIEKYGRKITVNADGSVYETFGFIQPLNYKSRMYMDGTYTDAGYCDGKHYIYIGKPIEVTSSSECTVYDGNNTYVAGTIKEMYRFLDTPLYLWMILTVYRE